MADFFLRSATLVSAVATLAAGDAVTVTPVSAMGLAPAAVAAAASADGAWNLLSPPAGPGLSLVYDSTRDRLLLLGAMGYARVWVLPLGGEPRWQLVETAGTPPVLRNRAAVIYDPGRDRVVLFGGSVTGGGSSAYPTDTWALSLGSVPTWSQLATQGEPLPGRRVSSAIYDPVRDRMVFYGGGTASTEFNDVWALSFSGTPTWTPIGAIGWPDLARDDACAVYDPVRDRMVIHGGWTSLGCTSETWALSFAGTPSWTTLASGAPSCARIGSAAVYDRAGDRMVMFGGQCFSACSPQGYFDDVWALPLAAGGHWAQLSPGGVPPTPRSDHVAVFDPARRRMLIHGGFSSGSACGSFDELWALNLDPAPSWELLVPGGGPGPGRARHSLVYDPDGSRALLFGGVSGQRLDDCWTLSLADETGWKALTVSGGPPAAREGHAAVFDAARRRMLVLGGYDGTTRLGDVWQLAMSGTPTWSALAPLGAGPGGRSGHSAVLDGSRDRLLLFGGYDGSARRNDVWQLSLAGQGAWTPITPAGTPPVAREGHAAVFDPVGDRMLVLAGWTGASYLGDVWEMSLGATPIWTQLAPGGAAWPARSDQAASYDALRDRVVVSGGVNAGGVLGDTWALVLGSSPAWIALAPAFGPGPRVSGAAALHDPVGDRMLVQGGFLCRPSTWALVFGEAAPPVASCPGDVSWTRGQDLPLGYDVANPTPYAITYDWALTGERDWPGWPLSGSRAVGGGSSGHIAVSAAVPDSAADGVNRVLLRTWPRGAPALAGRCEHSLHDPTTPALLSLVSAIAERGVVSVRWYAAGGFDVAPHVERRAAGADWQTLAAARDEGGGYWSVEDHGVEPGARYGYRLAWREGGQERSGGEVWVEVPRAARLALAGARPNPSAGELTVAFALADARPASLELLDVSGRRVARRRLEGLGGGEHVVRLEETRALPSGIYLVRLAQGGRAVTLRACVSR